MSAADQDLRFHGDTVATPGQLDFAVNLVSGPPPGWLRRALEDGLSRMSAYPDQGPATAALAARHGRPPGEVVLLAGRRDLPGLVVVRSLTKLWGWPASGPATSSPHRPSPARYGRRDSPGP
jgi:hypothetical protein